MDSLYSPNTHSDPIRLPTLRPGIQLTPQSEPGLQSWIRGLTSSPVHYDPEALDICTSRWEARWKYYRETFREDIQQQELTSMADESLSTYIRRLVDELARLKDRFVEMDSSHVSAEVICGIQFILSLIEQQTPALFRLSAEGTQPKSPESSLELLRQEVKSIDVVYQFALQASNIIHTMKVRQAISTRPLQTDDLEVGEPADQDSVELGSPSPRNSIPDIHGRSDSESPILAVTEKTQPTSILRNNSHIDFGSPSHARERQSSGQEPAPVLSQALSSAASHRLNLLTLSGVSFFGAGMAWSTVFSGTRGDLVLISWAASCFIIGAVLSAAATSLLDNDGNLLERFLPIRWTVRILGLCSAIHAFVGILLVSVAILVLNPNASDPASGFHEGAGGFRPGAGRAAGAYSLILCVVGTITALLMRRRYTRRTWFV